MRRFAHVEKRLAEHGRGPADASLAEMEAFWNEARAQDKAAASRAKPGDLSG
jgi:ATP diphosphatase